ncbi:MAG TPA: hypothetical protein VMH50_04080 [Thermoleophilia bacterium]|nr:hypothetical protein [Thermoleophilia bacterium]
MVFFAARRHIVGTIQGVLTITARLNDGTSQETTIPLLVQVDSAR